MKLKQNDTVLFIGDSITEQGRNHDNPSDLGHGYPLLIASHLQATYPEKQFTFINRGIGGEKLFELKNRWEKDCLNLNPDVVSILIGINDTWSNASHGREISREELSRFEKNYRYLLQSLFERTDARVVLMEPFVLPYPKNRVKWRKDLDPRIQIIRKMAREYETDFIPLDGLLNAEGIRNGFRYYTGEDGVHPTVAGHGLIAKVWLENID